MSVTQPNSAPLVSGFTICRNSVKLGFPFLESIASLAPLCDEIVVALDDTGDGTRAALLDLSTRLSCQLRIVDSQWNLENMKGGEELSRQTNVALDHCAFDTVFYLQSDEALHEQDYPAIRHGLEVLQDSPAASLSFGWLHFYGDVHSVVHSRKWYRREIRAFKKSSGLRSYKDAQSFRKKTARGWEKLPSLLCPGNVYHYGHVRPRELMTLKINDLHRAWNADPKLALKRADNVFQEQYGIAPFVGKHPAAMRDYLSALPGGGPFAYELLAPRRFRLKHLRYWLSDRIERVTGKRLGEFKSYSTLRPIDPP